MAAVLVERAVKRLTFAARSGASHSASRALTPEYSSRRRARAGSPHLTFSSFPWPHHRSTAGKQALVVLSPRPLPRVLSVVGEPPRVAHRTPLLLTQQSEDWVCSIVKEHIRQDVLHAWPVDMDQLLLVRRELQHALVLPLAVQLRCQALLRCLLLPAQPPRLQREVQVLCLSHLLQNAVDAVAPARK